jgi:hypothetical protein
VVASRVKDTTRAGGGSDAVANSELLVERRFFIKYPHRFPDDSVRSGRMLSCPRQRDKRFHVSFRMSEAIMVLPSLSSKTT